MTQYLPVISAVIVAAITFIGNYYVSRLKVNVDKKTVTVSASDALRDDLLLLVERYEGRERYLNERLDKNEKQNEELQITINTLRAEINTLRFENQELRSELQRTRTELEKFERKVYYIPSKEVGEK